MPVVLGLDNKDRVHIISGLSEGDRVLTNPPLEDTGHQKDPQQKAEPNAADDAKPADKTPPAPTGNAPSKPDGQASAPSPPAGASDPALQGKPSPEQMRERMKNMTPEQRQAMQKRMREQQAGQRGNNAGAQDQQK